MGPANFWIWHSMMEKPTARWVQWFFQWLKLIFKFLFQFHYFMNQPSVYRCDKLKLKIYQRRLLIQSNPIFNKKLDRIRSDPIQSNLSDCLNLSDEMNPSLRYSTFMHVYILQQVLSEFVPDSHPVIKPVRVQITCDWIMLCNNLLCLQ